MPQIVIDIDVLNSAEIIKTRKGKVFNWLAYAWYSEEALKKKVETRICSEVVKKLRKNLDHGFKQQGISAKVRIVTKDAP